MKLQEIEDIFAYILKLDFTEYFQTKRNIRLTFFEFYLMFMILCEMLADLNV